MAKGVDTYPHSTHRTSDDRLSGIGAIGINNGRAVGSWTIETEIEGLDLLVVEGSIGVEGCQGEDLSGGECEKGDNQDEEGYHLG